VVSTVDFDHSVEQFRKPRFEPGYDLAFLPLLEPEYMVWDSFDAGAVSTRIKELRPNTFLAACKKCGLEPTNRGGTEWLLNIYPQYQMN
jgi:hypothetical protein